MISVASPHLVDVVLVLVAVEAFVFVLLQRRHALAILLMLLPGVCIMLALRAALAGAAWPWVPLALAASLLAHIADVRERWRERWPK